jgi:CubicO group peptidase (beta-lactamase class C family)
MKNFFLFVLALYIVQIGFAQSKINTLNNYLDSLTTADNFSGYVLIAEKGKAIFQKGYGYADRKDSFPNTGNSQFCLSSASKLFTGTAIVKLIQEKKIHATDTIGTYITGLAYGNKITIHHLLTHSSGLGDLYEDPNFDWGNIKNCTDVVQYICNQNVQFTPGDTVHYSTSGMILLGAVIEKVSGISYQEYLKNTFFIPLGMKHTTFVNYKYVQYETFRPSSYAIGYIKDSTGNIIIRRRHWDMYNDVPLSAGGIWSCANDLLLFDKALHNHKILNKEYLELMLESKVQSEWKDIDFGYVFMNINQNKDTHAVGHPGTAGGHHTSYFRYDKEDTTIIILTNYGFVNMFQISNMVEKIILN